MSTVSAPGEPPGGLPDDLPDDTGNHSWQRGHGAAQRVRDGAAERGALTWRLVLNERVWAAYATADPAVLAEMLDKVAATATTWAQAIRARGDRTC
ncbi:hypothetical protein [Actinomadura nitritigenes]|uniref:hypothetical protein n=1 Tax=Actinomadura nitritigenes TaxID=134602 RepID=UPI003D8FD6E5